MTNKEREELNKLRMAEFMTDDENELRKGYRNMKEQLIMIQEEMGLSRFEAINFLATLLGSSMRKG